MRIWINIFVWIISEYFLNLIEWWEESFFCLQSLEIFLHSKKFQDSGGFSNCFSQVRFRSSDFELALRRAKKQHIICCILINSQSGKVSNAIADTYNQGLIHNTQVIENVRSKRIELIDEVIQNTMKLFSDPSKYFWFKRIQESTNHTEPLDCRTDRLWCVDPWKEQYKRIWLLQENNQR